MDKAFDVLALVWVSSSYIKSGRHSGCPVVFFFDTVLDTPGKGHLWWFERK